MKNPSLVHLVISRAITTSDSGIQANLAVVWARFIRDRPWKGVMRACHLSKYQTPHDLLDGKGDPR